MKLIDIIAIILLSLNVIIAIISRNVHSAIGWGYGVIMYILYLRSMDANEVKAE